jgi:hypothetical protein
MSMRGLAVALLCGVLGLGIGGVVAYAVQPHTSYLADARPVTAVSPSLPIDKPTNRPYAPDIDYPTLSTYLPLLDQYTIGNDLARWSYHVPTGWAGYSLCTPAPGEPCTLPTDRPLTPRQIDRASQVRFRPQGEPAVGGYSLRVGILDNTLNNLGQMVATKLTGFQQGGMEFHVIRQTPSAIYFSYRDPSTNLHRWNFFQWFAVPGLPNATLEMSVSGRQRDAPGLRALLNRFADDVVGSPPPTHAPKQPSSPGTP